MALSHAIEVRQRALHVARVRAMLPGAISKFMTSNPAHYLLGSEFPVNAGTGSGEMIGEQDFYSPPSRESVSAMVIIDHGIWKIHQT